VAIQAPGSTSDVGVAVPLEANVSGGAPPYDVDWSDSLGDWGFGGSWSVNVSAPGTVEVRANVTDVIGDVAASSLRVAFVQRPTLSVTAAPGSVDVGVPFPLQIASSGGIAPLEITWEVDGDPSNGTVVADPNSTTVVSVSVDVAGPVIADVSLADASGARVAVAETVAIAYPPPSLALGPVPAFAEAGFPFELQGLVLGGAPPLSWTLLPSVVVSEAAPETGTVGLNGSFDWSGDLGAPGNATLEVAVTDAVGAGCSENLSIAVLPALSVQLTPPPGDTPVGSTLTLEVVIGGGAPPYDWSISSQGTMGPAGSLPAPGNLTADIAVANVSELSVLLSVRDALGGTASSALSVPTAPAVQGNGTPPGLSDPGSLFGEAATPAAIALSVLTVVAIVLPRWRRRRAASAADPADARQVVERLLREEDGIDRETLAYRGESEGLARSEVFGALAELRGSGRLTTRDGLDGEELLALTLPGPATPTEAPR
jgi:hypothetical protein